MNNSIFKPIIILIVLLLTAACKDKKITSPSVPPLAEKIPIHVFEPIEINGINQWILIRSNDISKPILLILHGGPGQSIIPFAHEATGKLLDDFVVVHWDQRGCGLSYDESIPVETINIKQFLDDTKQLTRYLLDRFDREKIFLLGHSWGSILGLYSIRENPGLYYAYIGAGQIIREIESAEIANSWLKEQALEQGNELDLPIIKRGEQIKFANRSLILKYGGTIHNITIDEVKTIKKTSPYFPEKYTDELDQKGKDFSIFRMWPGIKKINMYKEVPRVTVPVYFFCGNYDYITPNKPVISYFKLLQAPYKEIIRFEKSAHRMDIEEPDRYQDEIIKIGQKWK